MTGLAAPGDDRSGETAVEVVAARKWEGGGFARGLTGARGRRGELKGAEGGFRKSKMFETQTRAGSTSGVVVTQREVKTKGMFKQNRRFKPRGGLNLGVKGKLERSRPRGGLNHEKVQTGKKF